MNEWENVDSAMNEWKALHRGYEKARTILFPYLFLNFLTKDTLNLLKVMNIWTRSHVKYKNNGLLRMLCTQKRFIQIWNLRKNKNTHCTVFTCGFCFTSVGNLLKGPHIVTHRNQLEVATMKNLFFPAVLKSDVKDSFGYNKQRN